MPSAVRARLRTTGMPRPQPVVDESALSQPSQVGHFLRRLEAMASAPKENSCFIGREPSIF